MEVKGPRSPCTCSSVGCARRWRRPRSPCTCFSLGCARRCRRPRSPCTGSSDGYAGILSSAAPSWPSSPSFVSPAPPVPSPPRLPLPPRPGTLGTCPAACHADTCPLPCLRLHHCSLFLLFFVSVVSGSSRPLCRGTLYFVPSPPRRRRGGEGKGATRCELALGLRR